MLDERKLEVLRAIVSDFIATNEPVGSKHVVERHHLGVSSATVRNDMSVLEDEGYIVAPHTSSGRIPTDKGYRLFVDNLSDVKPLSTSERRAIERFLGEAVDLDDVVRRAVRLLAQLTRQVAVVQYPSLTRAAVRHVEVVALTSTRLLVVVITDTGRVEQRVVDLRTPIADDDLGELRTLLNSRLTGRALTDAAAALGDLTTGAPEAVRPAVGPIVTVLLETLVDRTEERLAMSGAANLAQPSMDVQHMRPVLEALEEQVVLLRLLAEATDPTTVRVRIGEENEVETLKTASVVSIGYGSAADRAVGGLAVVGPTRMDYAGSMAAAAAVARYVGKILSEG